MGFREACRLCNTESHAEFPVGCGWVWLWLAGWVDGGLVGWWVVWLCSAVLYCTLLCLSSVRQVGESEAKV